MIRELQELGKKTIEMEKKEKQEIEPENRNQMLESQVTESAGEMPEEEEYLASIPCKKSGSNSMLKVSDLNLQEICDVKSKPTETNNGRRQLPNTRQGVPSASPLPLEPQKGAQWEIRSRGGRHGPQKPDLFQLQLVHFSHH